MIKEIKQDGEARMQKKRWKRLKALSVKFVLAVRIQVCCQV